MRQLVYDIIPLAIARRELVIAQMDNADLSPAVQALSIGKELFNARPGVKPCRTLEATDRQIDALVYELRPKKVPEAQAARDTG